MVTIALTACVAYGQTLSFARPGEPEAGRAVATLTRADALDAEALMIAAETPESRAMSGLRRFTAALMRNGEMQGSRGSRLVNTARALDAMLPEIDTAIAGVGREDDQRVALLHVAAIDLAHATQRITARPEEAAAQVRPGLAALIELVAGEGASCCERVEAMVLIPAALREVPGVTEAAIEAIDAFEQRASTARGWVAYRCAAHRAEERVARAAVAVVEAPPLLSEPARVALASRFDTAARSLADGPVTTAMDEIGLWGRAFELAAALADTGQSHRQTREAFEQLLTRISPDVHHSDRLAAYIRAAELCLAQRRIADERTIVRQLRPAWRAMSRRAHSAANEVVAIVPGLLRDSKAMTDPGTLAALGSLRESLDALAMLERLSRVLARAGDASREPVVYESWSRTGERVLRLAQQVDDDRTRINALAALEAFERRATMILGPAGEDDLVQVREARAEGAIAQAWGLVTDDRVDELLESLTHRRREWRERCEREGLEADADEAMTAARVVSLAWEATWAHRASSTPELMAGRGGWYAPISASRALSSAFVSAASIIVRDMLEGDVALARNGLDKLGDGHATARLMARLAREAVAEPHGHGEALVWLVCAEGDRAGEDIAIAARYATDAHQGEGEHAQVARAWGEAAAVRALRDGPGRASGR